MAIVRWNPEREIEAFRRQMNRTFYEMAGLTNSSEMTWKPAVELHEAEDQFVLKTQLPGIEAKELDINATREGVVIKGEYRHSQDQGQRYSEFRYGSFQRAIKLPVAIQNDKIQAQFNNGILTLTLPKVEAAVNKVVKVNLEANKTQAVKADSEENQTN